MSHFFTFPTTQFSRLNMERLGVLLVLCYPCPCPVFTLLIIMCFFLVTPFNFMAIFWALVIFWSFASKKK